MSNFECKKVLSNYFLFKTERRIYNKSWQKEKETENESENEDANEA